jgi:formylglycine-generating enzyme required for sulfatase activity
VPILSLDDFNALTAVLVPFCETENKRRALIAPLQVVTGFDIDTGGAPLEFTRRLIADLLAFGEVQPGRPALAIILEDVRAQVGVEKQAQIDALIARMNGGAIATPTPAPVIPAEAPPPPRKGERFIFISYSRKDRDFVDKLAPKLRRMYGMGSVWYDEQIHGGVDWWAMIEAEIARADLFIYIISDDSMISPYCRAEFREALRLRKAILPVVCKPNVRYPAAASPDLQPILARTQYVDMQHGPNDADGLTQLYASINSLMATYVPQPPLDNTPIPAPTVQEVAEPPPPPPPPSPKPAKPRTFGQVVEEAMALRRDGEDERDLKKLGAAKALLQDALATGTWQPRQQTALQNDLAEVTAAYSALEATLAAERQEAERMAQIREDLAAIEAYMKRPDTFSQAKRLWESLLADFPEFTPAHPEWPAPLAKRFAPVVEVAPPAPTTRQPQLGDRWTEPKTGLKMVYVPPGEFMMGSENGDSDEKPVHKVRITRGFWLGLTPITNAMYAKFIAGNGYTTQAYWTPEGWKWKGKRTGPKDYNGFTAPDQPRVGVTWYEAVAFCNWAGLRLPTEAEWEYAARGPENRVYPWGNDFDANRVIYRGNSGRKTHPVGEGIRAAGASWVGALDMSGNVWEWVSSLYKPYPYNADDGRESLSGTGARVLRGGSWGSFEGSVRGADRYGLTPDGWDLNYGFRCARSL